MRAQTEPSPTGPLPTPADVEIVIPVFNEERSLAPCVDRLVAFLASELPLDATITIVDNASTDSTWSEASRLAADHACVQALHLDEKGRGRALRAAWSQSTATVVSYMDVDLSTDLAALLPLVAPLVSGHSDVAIGSRLAPGSRVRRGTKREFISRAYNTILRLVLGVHFSDAQCGFKAVRSDVVTSLLPLIDDQAWFFDTELLVLAERNGLRIAEIPVDWIDDADSRVQVTSTAIEDLRGVVRMLRTFSAGGGLLESSSLAAERPQPSVSTQLLPFAAVGLVTTALFMASFWILAEPLGLILADVVSLAMATVLNLALNRRLTFAHRGPRGLVRHYTTGLVAATIPLSLNLVSLGLATLVAPGSRTVALTFVTVANLVATAGRFALLRRWVFATP